MGLSTKAFDPVFPALAALLLASIALQSGPVGAQASPDFRHEPTLESRPKKLMVPARRSRPDASRLQLGPRTSLHLGMTLPEIEKVAGPWPDLKKDWAQYPSGLTVMLRDDRAIHLSCTLPTPVFQTTAPTGNASAFSSSPPPPPLPQTPAFQIMGVMLGATQEDVQGRLGSPESQMARPDGLLTCWIYKGGSSQPDVGFIWGPNFRVEAMLMVEKDKLEGILITRGYNVL